MADIQSPPWKDGYYKLSTMNSNLFEVTGEIVHVISIQGRMDNELSLGTWKSGTFEEAHPDVANHTGKKYYNVDMNMWGGIWLSKGIVSDDGKTISIWSNLTQELGLFEWMSEKDYIAYNDSGEPSDSPSHHYKIQPEFNGKLLWISGAPGLGKSTCGLFLSKLAGYVYYEADAFGMHVNPYIPPNVDEPSLATTKQRPLKDVPKDRVSAVNNGMKEFLAMIEGKNFEKNKVEEFYTAMCKDIFTEKRRIGGDWVVAQTVPTRDFRDLIRKELAPDLMFVVLNMTKADQRKRIMKRHGQEQSGVTEWLLKLYDVCEPAANDEENAINVQLTNDMSREDVVIKILDMLPKK